MIPNSAYYRSIRSATSTFVLSILFVWQTNHFKLFRFANEENYKNHGHFRAGQK